MENKVVNYEELWRALEDCIYEGVQEGYDRGYSTQFDTWEHGVFSTLRQVHDKMFKLEKGGVDDWD